MTGHIACIIACYEGEPVGEKYDKPFITKKLKVLKRKRMREYALNGKSKKYLELKKEFDMEFLKASKTFANNSKNSKTLHNHFGSNASPAGWFLAVFPCVSMFLQWK